MLLSRDMQCQRVNGSFDFKRKIMRASEWKQFGSQPVAGNKTDE